jgi:hypothetical protein
MEPSRLGSKGKDKFIKVRSIQLSSRNINYPFLEAHRFRILDDFIKFSLKGWYLKVFIGLSAPN